MCAKTQGGLLHKRELRPVETVEAIAIVSYFVVSLGVGWYAGRGNTTGEDLHLGGRSTPWLAALISLVATEISTATLLGTPEAAFKGALLYIQLMAGSLVARYIVAYLFLPAYYDAQVVTVYEFLERRLNPMARRLTSLLFLIGRLIADGARLFMASLAMTALFDLSMGQASLLMVVTTAIYTLHGGIKAVIWTDVIQGLIFAGGGLAILGQLLSGLMNKGLTMGGMVHELSSQGKLDIIKIGTLQEALTDPFTFQAAFFGGIFLTLVTHGSDHDLVQRVLTCRNREDCIRSLLYSGWVALACGVMFLLVGSALWLGAQHGSFQAEEGVSPILTYLKHDASPVMRGILVAAILAAAMSTLSSAFSASTATLSNDLLPLHWRDTLAKNRLIMLVLCVVVWLLALGTNEFKNANPEVNLLNIALSSLTLVYGALLAFFVTALFTKSRPSPTRCALGAACGVITGITLFATSSLAFEWLVVAGLIVTFAILNVGVGREVPG